MTEDKLTKFEYDAEVLTVLTLPDELDHKAYEKPAQFWRTWSTYDDLENMRIIILLSTKNFSWVYSIKKPLSVSESYKQEGEPLFVTQKRGYAILPINLEQVVIQTLSELAIVNLKTRKLDYKVKFIYSMNLMLTSSQGVLSVPRIHNGILIDFGKETYSTDDVSLQVNSFRTMNDVHYKF